MDYVFNIIFGSCLLLFPSCTAENLNYEKEIADEVARLYSVQSTMQLQMTALETKFDAKFSELQEKLEEMKTSELALQKEISDLKDINKKQALEIQKMENKTDSEYEKLRNLYRNQTEEHAIKFNQSCLQNEISELKNKSKEQEERIQDWKAESDSDHKKLVVLYKNLTDELDVIKFNQTSLRSGLNEMQDIREEQNNLFQDLKANQSSLQSEMTEIRQKNKEQEDEILSLRLITTFINDTMANHKESRTDDSSDSGKKNKPHVYAVSVPTVQIHEVKTTVKPIYTVPTAIPFRPPGNCAVMYKSKCFHAIVYPTQKVTFADAKSLCKSINAKAVDIHDVKQYKILLNYLRMLIPDGWSRIDVWTGMTYQNNQVVQSTYKKVFLPSKAWFPGYPRSSKSSINVEAIVVDVNRDPNYINQGIFHVRPLYTLHGVICEM